MLLHNLLKGYRVILASASPRRKMLLGDLGLDLLVDPVQGVEELFPPGLAKEEIPVFLADLKSDAYHNELTSRDILVTADTIVWLDEQVIGKPADRDDAISMLHRLSGRRHEVLTGVVLRSCEKKHSFVAHSYVYFSLLSQEQIEYYVDTFSPYDKAGSYGIQEYIGYVGIEKIDGSFYNVMGLPVQRLCKELLRFVELINTQQENK
ncbi:MAG: Maf family nucleotide pyrophosphatase [Bacteroidales bacterium]